MQNVPNTEVIIMPHYHIQNLTCCLPHTFRDLEEVARIFYKTWLCFSLCTYDRCSYLERKKLLLRQSIFVYLFIYFYLFIYLFRLAFDFHYATLQPVRAKFAIRTNRDQWLIGFTLWPNSSLSFSQSFTLQIYASLNFRQ